MKLTRHLLITILLLVGCLTSCKPTQTTAEKASGAKSSTTETTVSTEVPLNEPIATTNPEENGWKNLRWGMSYDEVKENYKVEENDYGVVKCAVFESMASPIVYYDTSEVIRFGEEVEELYCSRQTLTGHKVKFGYPTGILMYKGRFFGKWVNLQNLRNNTVSFEDVLMGQLKEKFPQGKITNIDKSDKHFRYVSDDITVFDPIGDAADHGLYFYNTKMLHEALKEPLAIKNEEKRMEKERKEGSKKPF